MVAKTLTLADLPADQGEDFRTACEAAGRSPDEFIVTATEDWQGPGDVKRIVFHVNVTHKNTVRRYQSAHAQPPWTVAFEKDLKAGVFV
ncbi:hypothetical protein [Burkholderia vietnamiensis]|jgi:hypothetical protein|uniref:hypothetical protein n=1 Tax=Burkholderia vietnamiensis TaxID=60552 RepID=UPI000755F996|nr:hypothetical protein [Burkholderia vietnamiensis]KVF93498.1 hypothetical protein WJ21_26760 [Burkholderia vietnamiensis]MCA8267417.1 hypothetical protein [Burkholderia vietnamiensis]